MYESPRQAPISHAHFIHRLIAHLLWVAALLAGSLGVGMVGYVAFEGLSWIDAFLNAAMLLGGMGPVNPPQSFGGKLFAGLFALYAGLVFYSYRGVVVHTPFAPPHAPFPLERKGLTKAPECAGSAASA